MNKPVMTGAGAGGAAGATAAIIAWAMARFGGIEMDPGIEAAFAVLIAWFGERLGGYFARNDQA